MLKFLMLRDSLCSGWPSTGGRCWALLLCWGTAHGAFVCREEIVSSLSEVTAHGRMYWGSVAWTLMYDTIYAHQAK